MKHRIIYAWLMIALFAVVSFGGCGGSSDSGIPPADVTAQSDISMQEAINSADVYQKIVDQLVSNDLIMRGLLGAKVYALIESDDGQIWTKNMTLLEEDSVATLHDAYVLRRHYESEDVIVLIEPDIDFINKIRTDLGELPEDSSIVGDSGILDVYAMIRLQAGDALRSYTYTVPTVDDIINSEGVSTEEEYSSESPDVALSTDQTPGYVEDPGEEYSAVDFVAARWVNLYTWIAASSYYKSVNPVSSQDINMQIMASAVQNLTEASDCKSQTFDFSYNGLTATGITYPGWDNSVMAFKRSRINSLGLDIYAAHSFQTGNDYYYIQSTASTTTQNYKSVNVSPTGSGTIPYLYGYTKYLGFEAWLDGATAGTVTLVASNPSSLKGSPTSDGAKYSATTSRNLTNWTGVKRYTSHYAIEGANYSHALNWTPYGYDIVNNSGYKNPTSAAWYADAYLPAVMWGSLVTSGNSTGTLSYNADWVWEVKPSFWRSHTQPKLNVEFAVRDGATIGEFTQGGVTHDRADRWFGTKRKGSMILTPPPHVAAHLVGRSLSMPGNYLPLFMYNLSAVIAGRKTYPFAYTPDGDVETLTLKVFAEDSWTLTCETSDGGNWVKVSETSGTATGANAKDVTLTFERNPGSSRVVQINIQSGQDIATVYILQKSI